MGASGNGFSKHGGVWTGARSAGKVEEADPELGDLDGAASAYEDALGFDDTHDAFLARQRVALAQGDNMSMSLQSARGKMDGEQRVLLVAWRRAHAQRPPMRPSIAFDKPLSMQGREMKVCIAKRRFGSIMRREALFDAVQKEFASWSGQAKTAALILLSQLFDRDDKFRKKIETELRDHVAEAPECGVIVDRLVRLLVSSGDCESALDVLVAHQETVSDDATVSSLLFRQGEIAELHLEDAKRAALLFEEAHSLASSHPFAGSAAVRCWVKSKEFKRAIGVLRALADDAKDADVVSRNWYQVSRLHRMGTGDEEAANTAAQLSFEASSGQPAALDDWLESLDRLGDAENLANGLVTASQVLSSNRAKVDSCYAVHDCILMCVTLPRKLVHFCRDALNSTHCMPVVPCWSDLRGA